jgi:phosphohistidine phosphatase SixA
MVSVASRSVLGMTMGVAVAAAVAVAGEAPSVPAVSGEELVRVLRQGGYVIYLRHAATDPDKADEDRVNLDNCQTQRPLSDKGRQQAREIGAALKALRVPIGKVITSPYCRCVDTAQLAFGRSERSEALYFAVGSDREQRNRQSAELRRMLAAPPAPGTNTVLVSHTANLKEAAGIWPKPEGVAVVFQPSPNGGFKPVGQVLPEEWGRWAQAIGPQR